MNIQNYMTKLPTIDDVTGGTDPMQKLLDDYKVWHDNQVRSAFHINESTAKVGLANTTELQSKLTSKKLDEELQKIWGRNY